MLRRFVLLLVAIFGGVPGELPRNFLDDCGGSPFENQAQGGEELLLRLRGNPLGSWDTGGAHERHDVASGLELLKSPLKQDSAQVTERTRFVTGALFESAFQVRRNGKVEVRFLSRRHAVYGH